MREVVAASFDPLLDAAETTPPDEAGDAPGDVTARGERLDAHREERETERARDDDDDDRADADRPREPRPHIGMGEPPYEETDAERKRRPPQILHTSNGCEKHTSRAEETHP